MPPCIVDAKTVEGKKANNALQLNNLKKAIPEEAFAKSLPKSLGYMIFDYVMIAASFYGFYTLNNSAVWQTMPLWQQAIANVVYWNITGFFMWCTFMVGHDCGHTTFSDYEIVNDIAGHIAHGFLMVPYYPWQLSHRRHHMYHNHVEKDYSHPWYTPDRLAKPDEYLARFVHSNKFISFFFPFYGWQVYLYGLPDGSHFFPFSADRMWKDSPVNEKIKCVISSLVCVGCLATLYYAAGQSLSTLAYYYLGPYIMFSWWLVTVTYLQHHSHDTLVYDDKDWKFVDAAFETVDRSFGFGIDSLHHHITDGHVVHHLFFTKIPHYNLPIATKAVKSYLEQNDLGWMYKYDKTYDFPYRVHSYMTNFGFKSTRASLVGDRKAHVMKKKE